MTPQERADAVEAELTAALGVPPLSLGEPRPEDPLRELRALGYVPPTFQESPDA